MVLHGGWNASNSSHVLTGTFVWDGVTSIPKNNGPATFAGAMAYHPATDLVVLQAGQGAFSTDGAWDGQGWIPSSEGPTPWTDPYGPPNVAFPAMAEDALGHVVFFGGGAVNPVDSATGLAANPPSASVSPSPPPPECQPYAQAVAEDPVNPPDMPLSCYSFFAFGFLPGINVDQGGGGEPVRGDTWILVTPVAEPLPGGDRGELVTVEVAPSEIDADGESRAQVTFTATRAGLPERDYRVTFSTNGDVRFDRAAGMTDSTGKYSTFITASTTPGFETISADWQRPVYYGYNPFIEGNPRPVSTTLSEKGISLALDPRSLPADGRSKSVATAKVFKAGLVGESVCFSTDGEVTFSTPDPSCGPSAARGTKVDDHTWTVTMTAPPNAGNRNDHRHRHRFGDDRHRRAVRGRWRVVQSHQQRGGPGPRSGERGHGLRRGRRDHRAVRRLFQ